MFIQTGRILFEAVRQDMADFYQQARTFDVRVEYDANSITCRGIGDKCRICLTEEFSLFELSSLDDFHFSLLIICHELAHYLHKHNEHHDESKLETKSIEDWADTYGARLMMTLITFGSKTQALYNQHDGSGHSGRRIDSMANALTLLARTYFNTSSDHYSNRLTRVGHCVAGINSFLDRYFKNIDIGRSMSVMQRIYLSEDMKKIVDSEYGTFMINNGDIDSIDKIHKRLQKVNSSITNGLRDDLKLFIETSYQTTKEERRRYVEYVQSEAKRQGLKL
jgi:hypothetical protein